MAIRDTILKMLQEAPKSTKELGAQCKVTDSSVHTSIYDLKKMGYIIKSKKGLYHLATGKFQKSSGNNCKLQPMKDPRINLLSQEDAARFFDMKQKIFFYTDACEALLSSAAKIDRMRQ